MDTHDQILWYYQAYQQEDEDEEEERDYLRGMERRNVEDKAVSKLSKEIAFNYQLPYSFLQETLEEDQKRGNLLKHYRNCLTMRQISDSEWELIHPNEKKNAINCTKVTIEDGTINKVENVFDNLKLMHNQISQLQILEKDLLISKDYYNIQLTAIENNQLKPIHSWHTQEPLIKFQQSPYIFEDILILSENSNFYWCNLDNQSKKKLTPDFNYQVDKQTDYDFRQDLNYFDFGFHPKVVYAGNFKNLFTIDTRADQVNLLIDSHLHREDNSFNKISSVKRMNEIYKLALIDEEKFYIYDVRQNKQPWFQISHFLNEVNSFAEIITQCTTDKLPKLGLLSNLESLLQPQEEFQQVQNPFRNIMAFSNQHPSQLINFKVENFKRHKTKESQIMKSICQLSEWEYGFIVKGQKPQLIQTSSMYNVLSKIRGCQFIEVQDKNSQENQTLIFTCDNLGGLYVSVKSAELADKIAIGSKVITQDDIIAEVRLNANEEQMIAQSNFEQQYTFEEMNCFELLKELIEQK